MCAAAELGSSRSSRAKVSRTRWHCPLHTEAVQDTPIIRVLLEERAIGARRFVESPMRFEILRLLIGETLLGCLAPRQAGKRHQSYSQEFGRNLEARLGRASHRVFPMLIVHPASSVKRNARRSCGPPGPLQKSHIQIPSYVSTQ